MNAQADPETVELAITGIKCDARRHNQRNPEAPVALICYFHCPNCDTTGHSQFVCDPCFTANTTGYAACKYCGAQREKRLFRRIIRRLA